MWVQRALKICKKKTACHYVQVSNDAQYELYGEGAVTTRRDINAATEWLLWARVDSSASITAAEVNGNPALAVPRPNSIEDDTFFTQGWSCYEIYRNIPVHLAEGMTDQGVLYTRYSDGSMAASCDEYRKSDAWQSSHTMSYKRRSGPFGIVPSLSGILKTGQAATMVVAYCVMEREEEGGFRDDAELTGFSLLAKDTGDDQLCLSVGLCDDISCETKRSRCNQPTRRINSEDGKRLIWTYRPMTKQVVAVRHDALAEVAQGQLCLTVMSLLDQWSTTNGPMPDVDMKDIHNGISAKLWRCNADPTDLTKDLGATPRAQQWDFDSSGRLVPHYDHLSALGPSQPGAAGAACNGCKTGSGADAVNNIRQAGTGTGWDDAQWVIKPSSRWERVELGYGPSSQ
jgi:hypothetical protein